VRERFAGVPADSDAVGRTSDVTGTVTIARPSGGLVVSAGRFDVNLQKLQSDDNRRDNRMRTQGLETNRFPTSTFVLAAPIALPADATNGQPFTTNATGDLTLHGVTKRVTMPLQVRMNPDGRIEAVGSLKFPMSDFAIDPPNVGGFVTVASDATLEVQIFLGP
jgi:polyisoprenoid-binding protein YceI